MSVRTAPAWAGWTLSLATVLVCLLLGEVLVRLLLPQASLWHYINRATVRTNFNPVHSSHMRYDSVLGFEPVPGSTGWLVGKRVSYTAEGTRSHNVADGRVHASPPILAVGDSLTEGWGVGNDETWPAHLERDTGVRVLNAGVRGYGLDQIVLRAEKLAPEVKPRTIVLAFIADDILRTSLAIRHRVHKPYFVPVGEGLELRNVPVPTTPFRSIVDPLRQIVGYSELLDFTIGRLGLHEEWLGGDVYTYADSGVVACRLMDRFAALVRKQETRALVVGLPSDRSEVDDAFEAYRRQRVADVLACARRAGLATLDAHAGFIAAGTNGNYQSFYSDFHFTDRGNALAARLIASALGFTDH